MLPALALAPLTLAAVLVLSGLAKLPDPGSTHSMLALLRLPGPLATRTVARLVPWAELTVAALLLTPWRWTFALGALGAVALFFVFWVVVARAMTFDPRPACRCFGRVGDHRITSLTVVRNTVLLGLALCTAALALVGGTGTGLLADFRAGDWAWLLLAGSLAGVAVLVLGTGPGRQPGAVPAGPADPSRADASAAGTRVADGLLIGPDHEVLPLRRLAAQQPQLLVLANCWCGSTVAVLDRLAGWRGQLPGLGIPLVHTHVPWAEPRLAGVPDVWWDPGGRVYAGLQVGPSPAAVLVGTDGQVLTEPVHGVEAIGSLVADLVAATDEPVRAPGAP